MRPARSYSRPGRCHSTDLQESLQQDYFLPQRPLGASVGKRHSASKGAAGRETTTDRVVQALANGPGMMTNDLKRCIRFSLLDLFHFRLH